MIEIKSFEEAYELYANGKLPLNLLKEQAFVLLDSVAPDAAEVTEEHVNQLMSNIVALESYNGYLGGNVFICETLEDLKQVEGFDLDFAAANNGRWPNITDMPLVSDLCNYVKDEPKFITFLVCWNNAGGPVYYIPEAMWTDNVKRSLEITAEYWSAKDADSSQEPV